MHSTLVKLRCDWRLQTENESTEVLNSTATSLARSSSAITKLDNFMRIIIPNEFTDTKNIMLSMTATLIQ